MYILTNNAFYLYRDSNGSLQKTTDCSKAEEFTVKEARKYIYGDKYKEFTYGFFLYDTESKEILVGRKPCRRKMFPESTKRLLYEQADGRCVLCGRKIKFTDMTVDHIRPRDMNGSNCVDNLQCTCETCNMLKNQMLPDTFFDRINEIYLYQMQRKYGKKLKWKLANKLIKSMAQ